MQSPRKIRGLFHGHFFTLGNILYYEDSSNTQEGQYDTMCNTCNTTFNLNRSGCGCNSCCNGCNSCNGNSWWNSGFQRICRDCNGNIRVSNNGCGCGCNGTSTASNGNGCGCGCNGTSTTNNGCGCNCNCNCNGCGCSN